MATILLRTVEERALTNQEVDDNFTNLNNELIDTSVGTTVSITALVTDVEYYIESVGDSDFTDVGAATNTVGTLFVATGTSTGTGTAVTAQSVFGINTKIIPREVALLEDQIDLKQDITDRLSSFLDGSTNGILSLNGDVITARTITSGSDLLSVTNGNGASANPIITLSPDVLSTTNTKTLTNKTISGADNTITNISLTTSVTGVLGFANGGTNANTAAGARTSLDVLQQPSTTGLVVRTGAGTSIARTIEVSGDGLTVTNGNGVGSNPIITISSAIANTANTLVRRDGTGNFTAGLITANLNGNAATVTNGVYTNVEYNNPSWLIGLAGSKVTNIPNSSLTNNSITINGTVVSLGGSITIPEDLPEFVARSGSSMTGFLTLSANPTNALHAATKSYVDNVASNLTGVKAWAALNTNNMTVVNGLNITSVARLATGRYQINIQPGTFENGNFCVNVNVSTFNTNSSTRNFDHVVCIEAVTANYVIVNTHDAGFSSNNTGHDVAAIWVSMIG